VACGGKERSSSRPSRCSVCLGLAQAQDRRTSETLKVENGAVGVVDLRLAKGEFEKLALPRRAIDAFLRLAFVARSTDAISERLMRRCTAGEQQRHEAQELAGVKGAGGLLAGRGGGQIGGEEVTFAGVC
jgi:hypothetical protein